MGDKIDMSLDDIIKSKKKTGGDRGRGGSVGGGRGKGKGGRSRKQSKLGGSGVRGGGVQQRRRGSGNRQITRVSNSNDISIHKKENLNPYKNLAIF